MPSRSWTRASIGPSNESKLSICDRLKVPWDLLANPVNKSFEGRYEWRGTGIRKLRVTGALDAQSGEICGRFWSI